MHSSKAIAISAPSAICTSIECSGVKKWLLPSRCERKRTPSSVTLRSPLRLRNLKAAGVGEHCPRPAHEAVQPAHAADSLVAGAQIKMISIGENDLRAQRFQHILRDGLHRSRRAHRHKDRRFHRLMGQAKLPAPAARFGCRKNFELPNSLNDSIGKLWVPQVWISDLGEQCLLMARPAQPQQKTNPCLTRHSQRSGGRLGVFNLAVEQIFSRREELQSLAEVVRGIGVQAKVSVQQKSISIVIKLASAQPSLQTQCSQRGLNARTFIVVRLRATSGIQLPKRRLLIIFRYGSVCILVAALDGQPAHRRNS